MAEVSTRILRSRISLIGLRDHGRAGVLVYLRWERPDWTHGPTHEHLAWVYGGWCAALLEAIGVDPAAPGAAVEGTAVRIEVGDDGWTQRIGHVEKDQWFRPSDWFDPRESKAGQAWN